MQNNNQIMIDSLTRQRNDLDNMIKNYQTMPASPVAANFNQMQENLYEVCRLNDTDEIENIAVFRNTIFLNEDYMQIKKLDGTIEKYEIKKVYPKDRRDLKIEELTNKVAELERRLLDEHTESIEPTKKSNESRSNADGYVESKSETTSKATTRVE